MQLGFLCPLAAAAGGCLSLLPSASGAPKRCVVLHRHRHRHHHVPRPQGGRGEGRAPRSMAGAARDLDRLEGELEGMRGAVGMFLEQLAEQTKAVAEVAIAKAKNEKFGLAFDKAMCVERALPDSAAARAGLDSYAGWTLTHVDKKVVSTLGMVQALVKDAAAVRLTLRRYEAVHVDPTLAPEEQVKQCLAHLVATKRTHSEQLEALVHWLEKYKDLTDKLEVAALTLSEERDGKAADLAQLRKLKKSTEKSRLGTLSNFVVFSSGEG
eukprot:TRINITY_DN984_c0_g1_i1.p2 TRINITY_DN984_c0_g1~~TRINITY_DN984_c0_g1_i1.p2  ORF type:complete len:268 (+),score=92.17 TRINITY_DN984_c0_g1_i1:870-1673(+)